MKRLEKLRDEGAREFCKEWPTEVYHPNDLTTFYEKGFDAATKELISEIERLTVVISQSSYDPDATEKHIAKLMRVIEIQREGLNKIATVDLKTSFSYQLKAAWTIDEADKILGEK